MPADSVGRRYDRIGVGYASRRRSDPRWEASIHAALGDAATVLNVGAGTGSYEPRDRTVVALEPSRTMIEQRQRQTCPTVRGSAEALPFADHAFDAGLAIFTVHHWPDPARGLAELQRVSRRQVVVTWDPRIFAERMWLVADYLPQVYEHEATLATEQAVLDLLDHASSKPLLVPFDCSDGVLGAYWRRPEAFLDPAVRQATSGMALLEPRVVEDAMSRLETELRSGEWHRRHGDLLDETELDLGYRLVIAGSTHRPGKMCA